MRPVAFILLASLALYAVHRLAVWAENEGWIYYRKPGRGAGVGNALLEVDAMLRPEAQHMIEVHHEEELGLEDESDTGEPARRGEGRTA